MRLSRKFVAILMLLWLPLSSGSALAASITMQMLHGQCKENVTTVKMHHAGMGEHHMHHHGAMPATTDEHSPSCSACGVCHLACAGYLGVPSVAMAAVQAATLEITPYLIAFNSVTSVPLLPPPLVRT